MFVVKKRDANVEPFKFDKICERISKLINKDEEAFLNPIIIVQKVAGSCYNGITTEELDLLSANICINLSLTHPLYSILAGRIEISNLQKKTADSFVDKQVRIHTELDLLNADWLHWVVANRTELENMINYDRDYIYDYFGFKTLEKSYLIKIKDTIIERPQDMLMRVASFINCGDLHQTKKTYDLLSQGNYTHATPTLFNAGTKMSQLSSCFLMNTTDSIEGITKTWADVAQISKWGGGIGLGISNIRANGSIIRKTNGPSSGVVPMLKVYNEIARYVNQGGKRKGSIAVYIEPHHPDILAFLNLGKKTGSDEEKAKDLFLALWISDLFMKQVESDGDWYLMCPDKCPGLENVYGDEYETLYWKYVGENRYNTKVRARTVFDAILSLQFESGLPYISFKDSVNRKSNYKNVGVIRTSNLCNEIVQYSSADEYAVCNLASIVLNKFVVPFKSTRLWKIYTKDGCNHCKWAKTYLTSLQYEFEEFQLPTPEVSRILGVNVETYPQICYGDQYIGGWTEMYHFIKGTYDYDALYETAYTATVNLDKIIDVNFYPVIETKRSNMKHRPIGLGIQGLADTLVSMKIPFDSNEALDLNTLIMETIYYASTKASNDIAMERADKMNTLIDLYDRGTVFPEYYDPAFVFDKDVETNQTYHEIKPCHFELRNGKSTWSGAYSTFAGSPVSQGILQFDMWNVAPKMAEKWEELRTNIIKYGVRNCVRTALMPTATTSQILGNNECFEFFTNNIYTRRTLAGEFPVINKYLINDLINIGEWNDEMKQMIIANSGSIASFTNVPISIRNLYKTIWEIKQIWVLKAAAARGPFVDQTQSMNIHMPAPNSQNLYASHMTAWKLGLKTGMYYLRTNAAVDANKVTIDPSIQKKLQTMNTEACENCSA